MRPSASIVIPAWNEWQLTRACLESLRPTLGVRDEVIVVDNGSRDDTASGLRRYPWVRVVSHAENLGFAAGCNSGAAIATGDVVVFLNNDTLLPARWLEGLLAPLSSADVAATGPRSNFVSGPQLVGEATYDHTRTSDLQRFAREWRARHRRQTTDVTRLVGFCLAVRRSVLEQLGGFDEGFGIGGAEDDDLCLRIADAGHRLVIAHESFVHHHGHRTFEANGVDWMALQNENLSRLKAKRRSSRKPVDAAAPLLSACLIVKDEQENLPACLTSLRGLVDEVVVYDTGSRDRTVELARAAGATVVEGFWDDDFGRARNASLAHCTGRWVLHVDADEVVAGEVDAAAVRAELRTAGDDALSVSIQNLADNGVVSLSHLGVRLFRRDRGHWQGALHEQVVDREGRVMAASRSSLVLVHSGYTTAAFEAKDKHNRNVRVARRALEASGGDDALAAVNLGRSLRATGLHDEALVQFQRATQTAQASGVLRQAYRVGAETLIDLGRCTEAVQWVQQLRRHTTSSSVADYLEAAARLQLQDVEGALALLRPLDAVGDEDLDVPAQAVRARRGGALFAAQRWHDAAVELRAAVADGGGDGTPWVALVEAHWRAGLDMDGVVPLVRGDLVRVLAQVTHASPEAADAFAEALWRQDVPHPHVLALACQLNGRLPLARALEWSVRLRGYGRTDDCPLLALARNAEQPALERLRACAVLAAAFQDGRGVDELVHVASAVPTEDLVAALHLVDQLAPDLIAAFLRAAATDARRTAVLGRFLESIGAGDVLEQVLVASA